MWAGTLSPEARCSPQSTPRASLVRLSFRYRSADADDAKLSKSIPFQLQKLFAELQVCVFVCVRSGAKAD